MCFLTLNFPKDTAQNHTIGGLSTILKMDKGELWVGWAVGQAFLPHWPHSLQDGTDQEPGDSPRAILPALRSQRLKGSEEMKYLYIYILLREMPLTFCHKKKLLPTLNIHPKLGCPLAGFSSDQLGKLP